MRFHLACGAALALLLTAGTAPAQQPSPPPAAAAPAAEDPAIARLRRLLEPGLRLEYRTATVIDAAAGHVRLEDVRVSDGGTDEARIATLVVRGASEAGVAELEATDLRLSRDGPPLLVRRLRVAGLLIPVGQAAQSIELVADGRLDELLVEGIAFGTALQGTIGRLAVEELGAGRQTRVRLDDLSLRWQNDGPDALTLTRAAVEGDIARALYDQMIRGPGIPSWTGRTTAEGFTLLEGSRVSASARNIRLDNAMSSDGVASNRIAVEGLALDGVTLVQELLTPLGYTSVVGDILFESSMRLRDGEMSVPRFEASVPGLGQVFLALEADRLNPTAPSVLAPAARLRDFTLRYRDDGLADRIFRNMAAEQGSHPVSVRETAALNAEAALTGARAAPLRGPITRFLRGDAREIELRSRPPRPIPFREFDAMPDPSVSEVVRRFGLSATAR